MDSWWNKPRRVAVVIDNEEWMVPWCTQLVDEIQSNGDNAELCRDIDQLTEQDVSFFLSCHSIVSEQQLALSRKNLLVHASDLPRGRGMSPLTWQILEGLDDIPVCLLEAGAKVDTGAVVYRETLSLEGHELIDEMRQRLGRMTLDLCLRYLGEADVPQGEEQQGDASYYARRNAKDSQLQTSSTLAEQFNLLRVVDNQLYPAWFEYRGHRYRLRIDKIGDEEEPGT